MALNSSTCCCIPREDQQQQPRTRAMKENASAWPVSGVISHSSCEGGGYEYAHHRKASAEEAFKRGGHGTRSLLSRRRRRRPETMSDHHGTMHEASKVVVIPLSLGVSLPVDGGLYQPWLCARGRGWSLLGAFRLDNSRSRIPGFSLIPVFYIMEIAMHSMFQPNRTQVSQSQFICVAERNNQWRRTCSPYQDSVGQEL